MTTYKVLDCVRAHPFTYKKDSVLHHCKGPVKHRSRYIEGQVERGSR